MTKRVKISQAIVVGMAAILGISGAPATLSAQSVDLCSVLARADCMYSPHIRDRYHSFAACWNAQYALCNSNDDDAPPGTGPCWNDNGTIYGPGCP